MIHNASRTSLDYWEQLSALIFWAASQYFSVSIPGYSNGFILFYYFFNLFYVGQHTGILWASKDEASISFSLPILVWVGKILWEWIEAIWPIKLALFWFYHSHMMSCSYFSEWLQCVCLNKSAILLLLLLYFSSF